MGQLSSLLIQFMILDLEQKVLVIILAKKVAAFHPCLKRLPEAKLESFILIPLAEELSKQPSIDSSVHH